MNQNRPITQYTETELKAIGYDFLIQKETIEKNIQLVQDELSRRAIPKHTKEEKVIGEINHEDLQKKIDIKK